MDAIATACGIPLSEIGATVAKRLQKVIKAIRESTPEVTPEEIMRRARNYPTHMDSAVLTPEALAKHWATCNTVGLCAPPPSKIASEFIDAW